MRSRSTFVIAVMALLVATAPAHATIVNFAATLSGAQEVPPNASPAVGTGTFTFDTTTNILAYNISYSGLLGTESAAHFHVGAPGVAGAIQIGLPAGSPKGGFTAALTAVQETDLLGGLWYVNIHTTPNFPGGEIRGQLERATPAETSSWGRIKSLYK